jgi:hypothetical protein
MLTARSAPTLTIRLEASGLARAKQSTGMLVSSPATTAVRPRSALIWPSTGAVATMGPRRLSAMRTIARVSSQAAGERTAAEPACLTPRRARVP